MGIILYILAVKKIQRIRWPPHALGVGIRVHLNRVHFLLDCIPPSLVTQLSNYSIDSVAWLLWALVALLFQLPGALALGWHENEPACQRCISDEFYRVCMSVTLAQHLPAHSSLPLTHTSFHYYGAEQ